MKGQNKSSKRYSSCVTINHCLLKLIIVISFINYSHAWLWPSSRHDAVYITEPPEANPVITEFDRIHPTPTTSYSRESVTYMLPRSLDEDIVRENQTIEPATEWSIVEPKVSASEPTEENQWPTGNCIDCQFSCHSKSLCIKPHLVCDGINDCDDGSDELGCPDATSMIGPDLDCIINGECPRSYKRNPGQCHCDRSTYEDPVCTYRKGKGPLVLFSSSNNVYQANLPEYRTMVEVNKTPHRVQRNISAFEYRNTENLLIWQDTDTNGKIYIRKLYLDENIFNVIRKDRVAVTGPRKIIGFVFDWMNYDLIWIDTNGIRSVKIDKTSLNAMNQNKIYRTLDPFLDRPGSITIDVKKQCIFWVNLGTDLPRRWNYPKYIERIDIGDEPKTEKIVETNTLNPVGLAVDTENTRVYWIDGYYGINALNSIGYDGSNRITLYESLPYIGDVISMDIFYNYLYFTNATGKSIQRININNNAVCKVDTLLSVPDGSPTWVKIVSDGLNQDAQL